MTRADLAKMSLLALTLGTWGTSSPAPAQTSTFFEKGLGEISPAPSGRHQSAFERGEVDMSHRDFEGAINSFSEAIGFNMTNADAYFKRGQCYYYQKNYPSAVADFEYNLKMNPHETQAMLWLGTAEARLGHEHKAIEMYVQAMRNDPKLVTQFQAGTQGSAQPPHSVNPNNEGAVSAYEKAIHVYLGDGNGAATTTTVTTTESATPNRATSTRATSSSATSSSATSSSATPSSATPTSIVPTSSSTVVNSTSVKQTDIAPSGVEPDTVLNKPDVRIEQLDAAIKDNPSDAVLHFRRGVVYKRLGKTDKALADFTEAIRLDPMKSRFYLARARLYHEQNQPDLSQADIKQAQNVNPNAPRHVNFNDGNRN
jgi:tetratricopeptide (TPR) repeat protein